MEKVGRSDRAKCINSMLTMYWTVELDLRFCQQAIDGMDGWIFLMDGRGRERKVTNDKKKVNGLSQSRKNLKLARRFQPFTRKSISLF